MYIKEIRSRDRIVLSVYFTKYNTDFIFLLSDDREVDAKQILKEKVLGVEAFENDGYIEYLAYSLEDFEATLIERLNISHEAGASNRYSYRDIHWNIFESPYLAERNSDGIMVGRSVVKIMLERKQRRFSIWENWMGRDYIVHFELSEKDFLRGMLCM